VNLPDRDSGCGLLALGLLAALAAPGCGSEEEASYTSVAKPPTVRLVQPELQTIIRNVGQPGFVEAYERSSVYPKLNAYILKWIVDIGDKVKRNQPLAYLFVPELVAEYGAKKATVLLDRERVDLALKVVLVTEAEVEVAQANLEAAQAELSSCQSEVKRWESESKRLEHEVESGVVTPQVALQATNRWEKSVSERDTAKATVVKAQAILLSRQAALAEARVNVRVAEADLKVADSDEKTLGAWVGYLTLPAPFDGVIVARNANTFDFVLPTTGDPTAMQRAPYLSPSGTAAPIYVVDRTDIVRVFVDIPEQVGDYVKVGTKATVLIRTFRDRPIPATVTRTSWAINVNTRTLRAEIDLVNPGGQILPGMYAYGTVIVERPRVWALPVSALAQVGEKTICWRYRGGRAHRMEVETGLSDGKVIELTNRRDSASPGADATTFTWTPIDGSEQVILGDLTLLAEGGPVAVSKAADDTRTASATSDSRLMNRHSGATQAGVAVSRRAHIARPVVSEATPPRGGR
jgi:HlyD family secretion protein